MSGGEKEERRKKKSTVAEDPVGTTALSIAIAGKDTANGLGHRVYHDVDELQRDQLNSRVSGSLAKVESEGPEYGFRLTKKPSDIKWSRAKIPPTEYDLELIEDPSEPEPSPPTEQVKLRSNQRIVKTQEVRQDPSQKLRNLLDGTAQEMTAQEAAEYNRSYQQDRLTKR